MQNRLSRARRALPSAACVLGKFMLCAAAMLFTGALAGEAFATAPVIPTTGVDLEGWIPVMITEVGAIVTLVVGAFIAFLVVKLGITWVRRYVGK